ncbi:hypothetical protein BFJ69_g18095, partial [Fusarium oxysporum]
MASSTTIPPAAPDRFDLGIHTPVNLNRGARAALLQNSPAAVTGTIGVSPGPGRMAQTPSSPLNLATTAAATEGAECASPASIFEQGSISIIESANDLARERVEEYNTKLMVFQAFCAKFEEAAQQFATGPQRRFAQQFADSFLGIWKRELSCSGPAAPKPTYSSVAAATPPTDHDRLTHGQQQHVRRQTDPPHRQGQQSTIAPPRYRCLRSQGCQPHLLPRRGAVLSQSQRHDSFLRFTHFASLSSPLPCIYQRGSAQHNTTRIQRLAQRVCLPPLPEQPGTVEGAWLNSASSALEANGSPVDEAIVFDMADININNTTPAVIGWQWNDAACSLIEPDPKFSDITLATRFDTTCSLFELSVPIKIKDIRLKDDKGGENSISTLLLRICPSTVDTFSFASTTTGPESTRPKFTSYVTRLDFRLNKSLDDPKQRPPALRGS